MDTTAAVKPSSRKKVLLPFVGTIAAAIMLYWAMETARPYLSDHQFIYSFKDLVAGCSQGNIFFRFMWLLTDLTKGGFIVSVLGSILLCLGALLSAYLERKRSPFAGTGVEGNSSCFLQMFFSAFASILIALFLYGRTEWFAAYGFIPTFSSLLVSQTMITCYGKEFKKVITAIIMGGIIPFPIALFFMVYVTIPLGLPGFIAVSLGLVVTIPLVHLLVKRMPWMMKKQAPAEKEPAQDANAGALSVRPTSFFLHRILGDVGELMIWGSSWGTTAMYIGAIITWCLNPLHPVYGADNLPMLILTQICTAALSIFCIILPGKRMVGHLPFRVLCFLLLL